MLDHVQRGDQVERPIRPRQLLQPADRHLTMTTRARQLGRVHIQLDPAHGPVVLELLHRAPRTAAGIEHLGIGSDRQRIELRSDHLAPTAIPPVALVDLERRLHQFLVHGQHAAS
jgi:hypothetical protein